MSRLGEWQAIPSHAGVHSLAPKPMNISINAKLSVEREPVIGQTLIDMRGRKPVWEGMFTLSINIWSVHTTPRTDQTCGWQNILLNLSNRQGVSWQAVCQTAVVTGLSSLKFSNRQYIDSFVSLSYDLINIACPSEILSNNLYSNNSFKSNIPSTL